MCIDEDISQLDNPYTFSPASDVPSRNFKLFFVRTPSLLVWWQ